jgi:hypothetical protein
MYRYTKMTEWMDNVEMAIQKVSHFIAELYISVTCYLLLQEQKNNTLPFCWCNRLQASDQ